MPMARFFIFFSFFIFLFPCSSAGDVCPVLYCGLPGPAISFPFRIRDVQDERCGYPGLDLSCDNRSRAILQLPDSQEFVVDGIDYERQYVSLKDPDNCFAKQLRNSTFSGSLLVVQDFKSLVFANCSHDLSYEPGNTRVGCLSGGQYTVMFKNADDSATSYFREHGCTTWTVPVPIAWVGDSIGLRWDLPQCRWCEASGGRCRPRGSTDSDFGCSNEHGHKKSPKLWILQVIGVFAIIFLFGFGYYHRPRARVASTSLALVARPRGQIHVHNNDEANPSSQEAPRGVRRGDEGLVMGLDLLNIESCLKVQVDDEGRVPGSNDNVCVICLSEYQPKDVLRIIPECAHSFHAHCIERWLKRNASCPLCRYRQG